MSLKQLACSRPAGPGRSRNEYERESFGSVDIGVVFALLLVPAARGDEEGGKNAHRRVDIAEAPEAYSLAGAGWE